jgi:predicted DNA-binding transcriptional regulator AlpA
MPPEITHRRLRTPAAAEYTGYAESTLEKKRVSGDGPPFIRLGRVIVYDTRDLDGWLASRRRYSTSQADTASERPRSPRRSALRTAADSLDDNVPF